MDDAQIKQMARDLVEEDDQKKKDDERRRLYDAVFVARGGKGGYEFFDAIDDYIAIRDKHIAKKRT